MSINKGTVNLRTVKRSMRYLRPYWYYVIASLLCSAVCAAAELVIPIFCGLAIDQMIDQGKVLFEGVERYAIYVAVTACLGALCHWLLEAVNHEIICCVSRDLRDQTSAKIHRLLPPSFFKLAVIKKGKTVGVSEDLHARIGLAKELFGKFFYS